jgi:hypothetical protein
MEVIHLSMSFNASVFRKGLAGPNRMVGMHASAHSNRAGLGQRKKAARRKEGARNQVNGEGLGTSPRPR